MSTFEQRERPRGSGAADAAPDGRKCQHLARVRRLVLGPPIWQARQIDPQRLAPNCAAELRAAHCSSPASRRAPRGPTARSAGWAGSQTACAGPRGSPPPAGQTVCPRASCRPPPASGRASRRSSCSAARWPRRSANRCPPRPRAPRTPARGARPCRTPSSRRRRRAQQAAGVKRMGIPSAPRGGRVASPSRRSQPTTRRAAGAPSRRRRRRRRRRRTSRGPIPQRPRGSGVDAAHLMVQGLRAVRASRRRPPASCAPRRLLRAPADAPPPLALACGNGNSRLGALAARARAALLGTAILPWLHAPRRRPAPAFGLLHASRPRSTASTRSSWRRAIRTPPSCTSSRTARCGSRTRRSA